MVSLQVDFCAPAAVNAPQRMRLGEILIARGKLDAAGVERALRLQQDTGEKLGTLLVSSRLSRALYGGAKTLAFSLLILAFAPGLFRHIGPIVTWLAYASVYTTVVMCVLRGLPVVAEARHLVRR